MGMKPLLGDRAHKLANNLVNNANEHPSGEKGDIDPKLTVSHPHVEANKKLDPVLVSGPNQRENPAPRLGYDSGTGTASVEPGHKGS